MLRTLGLGLIAFCLAGSAMAQPAAAPAIKRTIIDRADTQAGQEAILGVAEIPAGGDTGRHIHHGLELTSVLEGSVELTVQGQPTRILKPGDSFFIHNAVPHMAKSLGPGPAKLAATWVVDKGKPLAEPAN